MLKPDRNNDGKNGPTKVLNAPVHLGSMAANLESNIDDVRSIWVMQRDDSLVSKKILQNALKIMSKLSSIKNCLCIE